MTWINILSYVLGIVGLIICLLFVGKLYNEGKDANTIISAVGSVASFFGLFIAILQIISVRSISQATKQAVEETKNKLVLAISLSDVSKAAKLIEEVQGHAALGKYELARLRLLDLRVLLVQFGRVDMLKDIRITDTYDDRLTDVNIDIANLYSVLIGKKKNFNVAKMSQNLESIATTLAKFENALKYE